MKLILRIAVVFVSIPLAWIAARWSGGFTLSGPLPSGGYEGTPATLIVVPAVGVAIFLFCVIVGNVAVTRYLNRRRTNMR
jgi:hypothetical protein